MMEIENTQHLPAHMLDVPLILAECAFCGREHQPGEIVVVFDVDSWDAASEEWDATDECDRAVIDRWRITVEGTCLPCASADGEHRTRTAEEWQSYGAIAVHVSAYQLQPND